MHLVEILVFDTGKSGVVAQRLAASLSSVGVAASFVHGAEWGHGDLGGCGICMSVFFSIRKDKSYVYLNGGVPTGHACIS